MTWYRNVDWLTFGIWATLTLIGLTAIYSATLGPVAQFLPANIQENFSKQVVWVGFSLVVLVLVQFTAPRTFEQVSYLAYAVTLLLTVATLFIGVEVNGAKSWLSLGGARFQTSELMKVTTVLAVANYLTSRRDISAVNLKTAIVAVGLITVPAVIILMQNDTGTALVFLPLIPVMLFLSGLPRAVSLFLISPVIIGYLSIVGWVWGMLAAVALTLLVHLLQKQPWLSVTTLVLGLLITAGVSFALTEVLKPHQVKRIEAFINPQVDPQGAGWNVIQAKTAIGSGGFLGKGFLQGTQTQLRFLPEQWTDFIFCVIGEEWGFVGASTVIMLLMALLMRFLGNAVTIKNPFSQLVFTGATTVFFTHVVVNLGSTMGLMPIIGIPLPFISYGGSAFMANTFLLAICMNLYYYQRELAVFGKAR
jgi:rod shape determining protein RodA